jgi:hypothetical protein
MDESVTADYIRHRLKVAGGNADAIFAPETFPEIHRLTLGIPRLINTLCDTALTACMVEKRTRVELATLEGVVQELGWRWAEASGRRKRDPGEMPAGRPQADDQAALLVHLPGKLVARVDIGTVPFTIGRGHGNGLVIEEKEISRRHALIDRVSGRYVIEDLNSRNGVLVNGKRREMAPLNSGDVIMIGGVKLVFNLKDEVGEDTGEHGEIKTNNVIAFGETQRLPDDALPAEELGARQVKE